METYKYIILIVILAIEYYFYQALRLVLANPNSKIIYLVISGLLFLTFGYLLLTFDRHSRVQIPMQILAVLFSAFILPKLLTVIFLLIEDIFRLFQFGFSAITKAETEFPGRRKFFSQIGLTLTALTSLLVLDGVIFGRFRWRVRKLSLKLPNLPSSFDGFKIIQISDVHSGSFSNPSAFDKAIHLITQEKADLILFTGDMVNSYADEFKGFIPAFQKLTAPYGQFSVLGNHDYGIYGNFTSEKERAENLIKLIQFEKDAGFTMLRNEHVEIKRGNESIYVVGVENWGIKPFPQYGDLDKAIQGIQADAIKVLMSHDPSHFDAIVKHHPVPIQLTLSGHTHGMQFGIDLKNFRWSPVQYKYPKWADLYQSLGKYLYVNRGFGVLGFPGRIGMDPEITLITLKQKKP